MVIWGKEVLSPRVYVCMCVCVLCVCMCCVFKGGREGVVTWRKWVLLRKRGFLHRIRKNSWLAFTLVLVRTTLGFLLLLLLLFLSLF